MCSSLGQSISFIQIQDMECSPATDARRIDFDNSIRRILEDRFRTLLNLDIERTSEDDCVHLKIGSIVVYSIKYFHWNVYVKAKRSEVSTFFESLDLLPQDPEQYTHVV